MLNRKIQPALIELEKIDFVAPTKIKLTDNVDFFHMKEVPNATTRLDLYFDAGKRSGEKGISSFVSGLLLSGKLDKSSTEIHHEINGLGGYFDTGVSMENAVISVFCLNDNLKEIFTTVIDAIKNTAFIEKEVKELITDKTQQFNINKKKVGFVAQRMFQNKLFVSNPLFASTIEEKDISNLKIEDLKQFHQDYYLNGLTKIVLVGDVSNKDVNFIIENSKSIIKEEIVGTKSNLINTPTTVHIEIENAVQTAIKIGRILFNKKHEDYLDFVILNSILGDYFGSRLMTNIREDKGYTYGIGSNIAEFNDSGYFVISTEVRKDVKDATLKEIKFELERLQTELVSDEELELIRNYILGQVLKSADGPYAMMDLFLSTDVLDYSLDFYNQAITRVKEITPQRLQELAKKYLNWEEMVIVTAG